MKTRWTGGQSWITLLTIFVGGLIKWLFDLRLKASGATEEEATRANNTGILLSSGFIAGESLMAVVLALLVIGGDFMPSLLSFQRLNFGFQPSLLLSVIAYPLVAFLLAWFTINKMRER